MFLGFCIALIRAALLEPIPEIDFHWASVPFCGLKGYGKAIVAGHIIGKQEQVIAAGNYIAVESSKIANEQNLEDKSLKGVKTVMKNVNSGIDNLVASLHTERGELNAKADSLVVATSEQGRQLREAVEAFKTQGGQPASVVV